MGELYLFILKPLKSKVNPGVVRVFVSAGIVLVDSSAGWMALSLLTKFNVQEY